MQFLNLIINIFEKHRFKLLCFILIHAQNVLREQLNIIKIHKVNR